MFKRILVPVDGSSTSNRALVAGLQLASATGGHVRLVCSVDELAYLSGFQYSASVVARIHEEAAKVLENAVELARAAGVTVEWQLVKAPGARLGETVASEARQWGADLIVVGTHGRRGLGPALMGSGAEQVVRSAPVPVLVIRGDDHPQEAFAPASDLRQMEQTAAA